MGSNGEAAISWGHGNQREYWGHSWGNNWTTFFAISTLFYALMFDSTQLMGSYFVGLTLLDVSLAAYSVYTEKHVASLVLLSVVNRLSFGLSMEVVRFFAMLDELLKVPMTWGTLIRKGL